MREHTDIERAKTSAELDAMKAAAKILDGLPLEVAGRVAAWLFDKYWGQNRDAMVTLPDIGKNIPLGGLPITTRNAT